MSRLKSYRANLFVEVEGQFQRRRMAPTELPAMRDLVREPLYIALFAIMAAGLVFTMYVRSTQMERYERLVTSMSEALRDSTSLEQDIRLATEMVTHQETFQRNLQRVEAIDRPRFVWAHVLDEVANALPADVWLETISQAARLDDGNVRALIRGYASSNDQVGQFIRNLEESPFLERIAFENSRAEKMGAENVTNFEITIQTEAAPLDFIETMPAGAAPLSIPTDTLEALPTLAPDSRIIPSPRER